MRIPLSRAHATDEMPKSAVRRARPGPEKAA
jgi:hypothetical protein